MLETSLGPEDLLLAYSDGVVEAQAANGEFFGEVRLTEVLRSCPPEPEQALASVLEAIDEFTRGHTPYDDVTLMMVARRDGCA
jgi:sigma-B regulation protein RsbU (phosphoserine phosphatase)